MLGIDVEAILIMRELIGELRTKVYLFKKFFEGFQSFCLWVNDLCCKYNKSKASAGL